MATDATTPTADWQQLLVGPPEQAYDQLADLLELPRISAFPRPGDARAWLLDEWIQWGKANGFVVGAKTKHGQTIQHGQWPIVNFRPSGSPGDIRSAMNCAQDGRRSLLQFIDRARDACRVLASLNEHPEGDLGQWLRHRLSGVGGQELFDKVRSMVRQEDQPEHQIEADQLLKRLRPFYTSVRAALTDAGCSEPVADRLILLNKKRGAADAWTFAGAAELLIPSLRLLLADQHAQSTPASDPKPELEPEVLNAETVPTEALVEPTEFERERDEQVTNVVEESFVDLERLLAHQAVLFQRVSHEVPEHTRITRQRQTVIYRLIQDMVEWQARQHAHIARMESSDLFEQLADAQARMAQFKDLASRSRSALAAYQQRVVSQRSVIDQQTAEINKLKDKIHEQEDRLTDPQVLHVNQKIKDVRLLLDPKGKDVMELMDGVKRATQMLDALIKAAK